ncbi:MAG: tetratricopeptide repeat protein [Oscillibacter sp.]|nr:tetratricopeptide repeat protein [Oscillibacter sp.]
MYDRALVLGMDRIDVLGHIGQSHILAGRYQTAEQCFREALESRPDDLHTITALARCCLHLGRTEEAESLFLRAMSRDIPEYNDWVGLGRSLRQMRRSKKAEEVLVRARGSEPEKPEAHYELGLLYEQMGFFRKAADEFEYLLEMEGEYARVCLPDLGVCYWQLGFFARAREVFERALALKPNDVKLYVDLALRYRMGGKFLEAHALLNKALELDPLSAPALVEKGHCLLEQGKFDEARKVLNEAIGINPKLGMAYRLLGRSYVQQGEFDQARTVFNKGIEADPNFWELYIGLWHCIRENNPSHLVGEDIILKALEVAPYIPDVYIEAGFFYAQNKEYERAEKMFLDAIAIDPENSVPYVQLADVYILSNNGAALEKLVSKMKNIGGLDAEKNRNRFERLYGFLAVYYRQNGDSKTADKYFLKAGDLRMQYYCPGTKKNFIQLYNILKQRGIKLVCMQYPMRDVASLRQVFDADHDVVFVSNEDNFRQALEKYKFNELFEDHFAGDFGHATRLGNSLIAKRLADELMRLVFSKAAVKNKTP